MSNFKWQITNVKCQMSNVKCQMSNVKCQFSKSNVKFQVKSVDLVKSQKMYVTEDYDDVSTKSIVIFIIVLDIWVIRVANLYDHFLTMVGYWGLWWCFNKIYCHFHHCALYMGHTSGKSVWPFFDSGRLLRIMMMFIQNLLSFSSLCLVYGSYEWQICTTIFWQC
jgi:hypothetical protein